ncbi:hypothetical protein B0H19DRAFT_1267113 [Mycena capillaripes]|nr:hypothetical protein B0H19DRAFT_1267113 [Mycena capillaripes]
MPRLRRLGLCAKSGSDTSASPYVAVLDSVEVEQPSLDCPRDRWQPPLDCRAIAGYEECARVCDSASLRYSPRFQDRTTLAKGSVIGLTGLVVALMLLVTDCVVFGSFYVCWILVALGFNLASTCTCCRSNCPTRGARA